MSIEPQGELRLDRPEFLRSALAPQTARDPGAASIAGRILAKSSRVSGGLSESAMACPGKLCVVLGPAPALVVVVL
jgi:hypothetical protein